MSKHLANAIGYPRAVMVKLLDTTITSGTMLCTERPDNLMTVKRKIRLRNGHGTSVTNANKVSKSCTLHVAQS